MNDCLSIDCTTNESAPVTIGPLAAELDGVDLGDQRRNRRACAVIEELGQKPQGSIPMATFNR